MQLSPTPEAPNPLILPLLWTRAKAIDADVNTEPSVLPTNPLPGLLGACTRGVVQLMFFRGIS